MGDERENSQRTNGDGGLSVAAASPRWLVLKSLGETVWVWGGSTEEALAGVRTSVAPPGEHPWVLWWLCPAAAAPGITGDRLEEKP